MLVRILTECDEDNSDFDNDDAVDDLQDPVIGALGVKNIESIVGCKSNQAVGQNVPVSYSHPRYLK